MKFGLHWIPKLEMAKVIEEIVNWRNQFRSGKDMQEFYQCYREKRYFDMTSS